MTSFTIRQTTPADAHGIAALLRDIHWFTALESESFAATEQRIRKAIEKHRDQDSHSMYVAIGINDEIFAYASVHWLPYLFLQGPEGYLSELFVAETRRGQGVGRHLLDEIKREAQRRDCSRLSLITSRHRESYKRRYYAKQGFSERESIANFVYDLAKS